MALVTTIVAAATTGCAAGGLLKSKPKLKLELRSTANLNNCGRTAAAPLRVRLLQVTDAAALAGAALTQVWGREETFLGGAFVARSEDAIDPASKKEVPAIELDPKARAVVVVGNFCKTQGSCWYHVQPRKGNGGISLDLTADASCLRPTKR